MAIDTRKPKSKPETASFTVDTQLFRELGELLVGRDSTALLELVKNSYDADATIVTVHGENVDSEKRGSIVVSDDGSGMTLAQFREGFLRLAGRTKTVGERRSSRYGRRYTGEKGVGRLATHKLASVIEIDSAPWTRGTTRPRAVRARIDWREIERRRTLDEAADALELASYKPAPTRAFGTQISLSSLRHAWSDIERAEFVASAEAFSPPAALVGGLHARSKPSKLLFKKPRVRDQRGEEPDPGFKVHLTGDFAFSSEHWDELIESVEWVLEIDARADGVSFCVAPTERELGETDRLARSQSYRVSHPTPGAGPFFQARIFARARNRGSELFRNWSKDVAGIRVYSEGFRVLPYGDPDNDWLEINRDYVARSRQVRLMQENKQLAQEVDWDDDDESALTILPSDSFVGAIFLTRERSGELEMLVNREGFVPNLAFESLTTLTNLGIALLTRARAAGREAKREAARERKQAAREQAAKEEAAATEDGDEDDDSSSRSEEVSSSLDATRTEIANLRSSMAAGNTKASERELTRLEEKTDRLASAVDALLAEQRLTPILASVGIQMSEFVHEINGLLAMASAIDAVLGRLREDPSSFASAEARRGIAETHQTVRDLRGRLERQASYLIDLTSPTAVRRRSRQRLAERLDRAAELVRPALERRKIVFSNRISTDLRTPPMFPAELTAVLLNLLTNAVKAAGESGRIRASSKQIGENGQIRLRIENSGQAVDIEAAERWFRPFETTTTDVDPLLGQGMGFGLPITRGILEEYGAQIHFVPPRKGYVTAIQVDFAS
jgi:signal transduction histidine kinase